ncbi:MAG: hypothetical protein H6619_03085 [Deltaproteobacteria bacterium]|nr:hypothetical protein [Deltaproteobacteria bacterium]
MATNSEWKTTLNVLIKAGFACLCISSICLYLSTHTNSDTPYNTISALWMMTARLAGIAAFFIGAIAIFNQRWTAGVILFVGSVILPIASLFVHGMI